MNAFFNDLEELVCDVEQIEIRTKALMQTPEFDPLNALNFAETIAEMDVGDLQKILDLMRDRSTFTDEGAINALKHYSFVRWYPRARKSAEYEIQCEAEDGYEGDTYEPAFN